MNEIKECIIWMIPFALAIKEEGFDSPKFEQKITEDTPSHHIIQSHTVDLQLLVSAYFFFLINEFSLKALFAIFQEKAHLKQSECESEWADSEDTVSPVSSPMATKTAAILTPPKSTKKQKLVQ